MVFPSVPLVIALWEYHKGGPPDSFSNSQGDQSPDATAARNRISDLVKNTGIEYQPAGVPQDAYKNPSALDDLYGRIQKMDLNAVTHVHQTWESLRNKLEQGHNTFGPSALKAIQQKWTGASGTQAANGISNFVKGENNLVISAQIVSEKVKLALSAVEVTKPGAQPTPKSTWTSDVASWVPGPTWKINDHRKTEANTANEHLINNVFYPAVRESDNQVPKAPQPTNPANTSGASGPAAPGASGPTGPSLSGASGPTGPSAGASGPSSAGASGPSAGASGPNAGASGPGSENTTPSSTDPSSTSDSSKTPNSTTTPSSYSGTSPSSVDTGSLGTSGTGPGGSGSNSGGGAGKSVPGGGGSAAGTAAARAASAAKGTNSNLSSMGGLGGAAGKGKKDDEREHKSKISEALVSEENGDELTGLGRFAAKHVPQVLGDE